MAEDRTQQKLVQFLDRRAWQPVMRAKSEKYEEADRKRLVTLRKKTETQKKRYEGYTDAGELRQQFQDDLHSGAAKKTESDLKRLKLPVQADIADEFFALADGLGVTADKEHHGRTKHHAKSAHQAGTKHRASAKQRSKNSTPKWTTAKKSTSNKANAKKRTERKPPAKKSARGR